MKCNLILGAALPLAVSAIGPKDRIDMAQFITTLSGKIPRQHPTGFGTDLAEYIGNRLPSLASIDQKQMETIVQLVTHIFNTDFRPTRDAVQSLVGTNVEEAKRQILGLPCTVEFQARDECRKAGDTGGVCLAAVKATGWWMRRELCLQNKALFALSNTPYALGEKTLPLTIPNVNVCSEEPNCLIG